MASTSQDFGHPLPLVSWNNERVHSHLRAFWEDTHQPILLSRCIFQTHFHESPVVIHLICCLQEVTPVCPHGCVLFRYDGSTCRAIKSRDERPPAVTGCNVLALVGISRGHYVGLDRFLDILGTLHHLPQLFQQLCCNFWTHLPTCNCRPCSPQRRRLLLLLLLLLLLVLPFRLPASPMPPRGR